MTHLEDLPTPEQHFGSMVRQAREARGWTQEMLRSHLAERGVHLEKTAMIRLEQGKRPIRLNEVTVIAKLFGLDLQQFSGTLPALTKDEYEVAKKELAEVLEQESQAAAHEAEVREQLQEKMDRVGRQRRQLAEQRWRYEVMIGEYEARRDG